MERHAAGQVSDEEFKEAYIIASDPEVPAERLGATVICLQNASGAAPEEAFRVYGETVLPALRRAPVA